MKYVYGKKIRTLRDRLTTGVAALALLANSVGMSLPFMLTQKAAAAVAVSDQAQLEAAIAGGESVINLSASFSVDKKISINRPVTLNGNGHTISSTRNNNPNDNSNNAALGIDNTSGVTLLNLTVNRGTGQNIHGINIWRSTASLDNVTITNFNNGGIKYGLLVGENSQVTVSNISTSGNSRGINVDKGTAQIIIAGPMSHTESWHMYSDTRNASRVVDTDSRYDRSDVFLGGHRYTLKPTPPAPATPTNLRFAEFACGGARNINSITPTWDAVSGAVSYNYRVGLTDGTLWGPYNIGNVTSVNGPFHEGEEGTYTFSVQAVDSNGLTSEWAAPCAATYDISAPTITWQLQPLSIYGDGADFHVRPITNEVGTIKSIYFNSIEPENLIRTLDSDHKNFDTKNTHNQTLWDSLPEGVHRFVAVFEDYAGNSTTSESNTFIIDRTGPTITVKPESVGDVAAKIFSSVSFSLYDSNRVDRLTLNGVEKDLTDNNWSDLNGVGVDWWFGEVEGLNTLVVYDVAGNSTTYEFTLDATAPDVPVVSLNASPSGDIILNGGITNSLGVVASWTVGPDDVSYQYRYFNSIPGDHYNTNYYLTQPAVALQAGTFTQGEGLHHIQVRAVDAAGNWSGWSDVFNVTYDITAPTVPTIITPANGQWFNSAPILNQWTTSDDHVSGVAGYQIAYNYDDGHSFGSSTCPGLTMPGYSGFIGCRDVNGLSRNHAPNLNEQGGVTIWVRAIDNAGNVGPWSSSVHYYYDHEAPVTDINVSPVVNGAFTVSGAASDNEALNRVYVQLVSRVSNQRCGGATINLIPEGDSANWSQAYDIATLMSVSATPAPCPEGLYAAHVEVVDMAGNRGTAGWTDNFMVNIPAPAAITSPSVDNEAFGFPSTVVLAANDEGAAGNNVLWAVRAGTCAANTNTLFGNVDGHNDPFSWTNGQFNASVDGLVVGSYCFVFNTGNNRLTRQFSIVSPEGACTGEGVNCENGDDDGSDGSGGNTDTDNKDVKSEVDCDGDGISDPNGCEDGAGSASVEKDTDLLTSLTGGPQVLGDNNDLTNTGAQNGGLLVLLATSLMAIALLTIRRRQEN